MRRSALLAALGLSLAGVAGAQEAGLLPLTSAIQTATEAVGQSQKTRRFELEFGGFRGNRWTLRPDVSPPGGSLTIWVDQGDDVVLHFVKYPNPRHDVDTSVDIDGIKAEVDGQPSDGVHILMRDFGVEEHTASFTAEKAGMILLYSRWGRPGHWGTIVVRKKKA